MTKMKIKINILIFLVTPVIFTGILYGLASFLKPKDDLFAYNLNYDNLTYMNDPNAFDGHTIINSFSPPYESSYPENVNLESSSVIITVKATGKRLTPALSLVTEVTVVKHIKGGLQAGQSVYVVEPVQYMDEMQFSVDGYLPMLDDTEYLLFLNELPSDPAMPEFLKKIYIPNWTVYGKYKLNGTFEEKIYEPGQKTDPDSWEAVMFSEEALLKYKELKSSFLSLYGL